MKKFNFFIMLGLMLTMFMFVGNKNIQAQESKIVFFELNKVLAQLPEYKAVEEKLKTYQEQLRKNLQTQQQQLAQDEQAFQQEVQQAQQVWGTKNPATLTDTEKTEFEALQKKFQEKKQELFQKRQKIQEDAQKAEQQYQEKQVKELDPLLKKVEDAIKMVSEEKGYLMVLRAESLLYAKPEHNISEAVLAKLK